MNLSKELEAHGQQVLVLQGGGALGAYQVGVYQISQNLLGPADTLGNPFPNTTVWGYGTSPATATYPGRSFEVATNQPIATMPSTIIAA